MEQLARADIRGTNAARASVSVVFEVPRGQNGHGRQHRSRMPRALPNPPDDVARIHKRQLRQGQSDARIYVDPANAGRDGGRATLPFRDSF